MGTDKAAVQKDNESPRESRQLAERGFQTLSWSRQHSGTRLSAL